MPTDLFKYHAAPEAIAVELRRARVQARRWQREVEQLEALLTQRSAEKEKGEWPYPATEEAAGEHPTR